jgi:hypothetical protein
MSSSITLQTTDGRIIHGINYGVNTTTLPSDPAALAAGMPGGMAYGVYHIHTPSGWQYIPASQIAAVLQVSAGKPT